MDKWTPVDVIMLILGATICFLIIAVCINAIVTGERLSPVALESMNKITHGLIGIIGVYVGLTFKSR